MYEEGSIQVLRIPPVYFDRSRLQKSGNVMMRRHHLQVEGTEGGDIITIVSIPVEETTPRGNIGKVAGTLIFESMRHPRQKYRAPVLNFSMDPPDNMTIGYFYYPINKVCMGNIRLLKDYVQAMVMETLREGEVNEFSSGRLRVLAVEDVEGVGEPFFDLKLHTEGGKLSQRSVLACEAAFYSPLLRSIQSRPNGGAIRLWTRRTTSQYRSPRREDFDNPVVRRRNFEVDNMEELFHVGGIEVILL